jgi:hypothetical protein
MNGDGLPDHVLGYAGTAGTRVKVELNTGDDFSARRNWDFNNDGSFTRTSTGEGWTQHLIDMNGDGLLDHVLGYAGAAGTRVKVELNTGTGRHRVESIIDGLGNDTSIEYVSLTNTSVYTKGSRASYPEIDLQYPAYVVSKVTSPNGLGGTLSTSYKYGGLKVNLLGRGSLGFAWMEATDNQTGIVTKTNYSQTFPYAGQVTSTEQRLSNGTLLGKTTASFNHTTSVNGKVYFPYTEQTIDKKYDLDGTLLATTTTENEYDAFANPTRITITTVDSEDTEVKDTISKGDVTYACDISD